MVRKSKEFDVRKNDIIDISETLFLEFGYEATSISFITEEIGIAKGTFYNYFRSKEDLLNALLRKKMEEVSEELMKITQDDEGNALDKLFRMYFYFKNFKYAKQKITDFLHEDRNVYLHHKIEKRLLPVLAGCYSSLIEQGISEGFFKVKYPYLTAIGLLGITNFLSENHNKELLMNYEKPEIFLALLDLMERMMGMEEGGMIEHYREMEKDNPVDLEIFKTTAGEIDE